MRSLDAQQYQPPAAHMRTRQALGQESAADAEQDRLQLGVGVRYRKVAAMHGRDAHQHGAAGLANPIPRDLLFTPWEKLYREPFVGITTDGRAQPGLFSLAPNGAPTDAMVAATLRLIERLSPEARAALMFPVDAREWRRWNNTEMYVW